jgi:hypothetical protein
MYNVPAAEEYADDETDEHGLRNHKNKHSHAHLHSAKGMHSLSGQTARMIEYSRLFKAHTCVLGNEYADEAAKAAKKATHITSGRLMIRQANSRWHALDWWSHQSAIVCPCHVPTCHATTYLGQGPGRAAGHPAHLHSAAYARPLVSPHWMPSTGSHVPCFRSDRSRHVHCTPLAQPSHAAACLYH